MAGSPHRPRQSAPTQTQAEVLDLVDRAHGPLGVWQIAQDLGCDRAHDLRRYEQIKRAVRSLQKKRILTFRTTLAGSRQYFRAGATRRAVAQLFAQYGEAEVATEIVQYACENEWIWAPLRKACLETILAEPDRLPPSGGSEAVDTVPS